MNYFKTIILLITLTFFQNIFSQEKIYFDKDWKVTTQENASFYRHVEKMNDHLFHIKDYYSNGNMQMDGYFSDLEKETFHNTITWYDESGQKTITKNYQYGKQDGEEIKYLSDGRILTKGTYKNGDYYDGIFYDDCCSYPLKYPKYKNGKQIAKISFYHNSNQVALEEFIDEDGNTLRIDYYDKNNEKISTLHYGEYSKKGDGTEIDFYEEYGEIIAIKSKRNYTEGKLNGEETTFDKNGKIWLKGTYIYGDKYDGYFLDGLATEQFDKGIQIGERVQYDANFNNIGNVSYQDGKPYQGILYNYAYEIHYDKGRKTKKIVHYNDNRTKVKNKIEYLDEKNKKIDWYNEQEEFLGTGYYIDDEIDHGFHLDWKYKHSLYQNGMKNGIEKEFDASNDSKMLLKTQTNYQDNTIIWKKTLKPNQKEFYNCDFKDDEPYNGIILDHTVEKTYINGKVSKEASFDKDWKTGKFTLKTETFYNDAGEVIKETKFKNGIPHTLEYNEDNPYNGRKYNYNSFITYKNGKIEGEYANFKDEKIIEKGKLIDGKREGLIHFTPIDGVLGTCLFTNDKPDTGIVSKEEELNLYLKGKKHGDCKVFFRANILNEALGDPSRKKDEIITTYDNGIKTKEVAIINGLEKLSGTFKDEKMYDGAFFIRDLKKIERYKSGKKHGITKVINDNLFETTISYNNGNKQNVEVTSLTTKQFFVKGTYKNNLPYNGAFITSISDKMYIITPYKNGKKHGDEFFINSTDLSNLPKNKGTYKNNKPYNGSFVVFKENLKTTSNYKDGKKHLYEKYEANDRTIDSLYYENGKIIKGTKFESFDKAIFKHFYNNGTLEKIITKEGFGLGSLATIIFPKENEFQISFKRKTGLAYNLIKVNFTNKKRTAGKISYIDDDGDIVIGSFNFADGRLTSGKIDAFTKYKMNYSVRVDKEKHLVLRLKEYDIKYYTEVVFKNSISKNLTYHDAATIIRAFAMTKKDKVIKLRQYLNDGTLLTEGFVGEKFDKGTMIEHRRKPDGTIVYTITTYPKDAKSKEDKIVISELNFEEMLEKVQNLEK